MIKYEELIIEQEVKDLVQVYNSEHEYVVLDCETTGLSRTKDKLLAVVLSGSKSGKAYFIDAKYASLLSTLKKPILCHNFKFDFHFMLSVGVDLRMCGLIADTLHLDYLLDENVPHSLDDIVQRLYKDDYKQLFWTKYKDYTDAPRNEQVEYACKDVLYTDRVYIDHLNTFKQSGIPISLLEHTKRLALALYDTEVEGIKVDFPYLEERSNYLSTKISSLTSSMLKQVEFEIQLIENEKYEIELDKRKTLKGKGGVKRPKFNFNSSEQLSNLLYTKLKLPIQKNVKTRSITCEDMALERLEGMHPIVPLLREYRGHEKVFTAFIEGTLKQSHNGRIYPNFNPCGTVTGRISHSEPNLSQLPSDGGIRGIYVPEENQVFISADYKQLEVAIAAHFSGDKALLSIIYEGASQHDITAAGLGIPRQTAKTVNFAMQYGAGANKIKSILGCTDRDAKDAYDRYWETYRGLQDFIRRCHDKVDRGEYLENPFGRRRRFPITFGSHWERERAKRQAPNSLVQGTGSDITSAAFTLVNEQLRANKWGKVLFTVHDELLSSVNKNYVDQAKNLIQTVMVGIGNDIKLTVPLSVDISDGQNRWED